MLNSENLGNHSISNLIVSLCRTCFLILPLETSLHNPAHLVITIAAHMKMPALSICSVCLLSYVPWFVCIDATCITKPIFRRRGVEAYKIWYTLQHPAAAATAVTAAFKCVCYSRILLTNIKLINVNIVYLIQNAKQTTKAISFRCTLPYMYSCEHTRRILPFGKHVFNFVFWVCMNLYTLLYSLTTFTFSLPMHCTAI